MGILDLYLGCHVVVLNTSISHSTAMEVLDFMHYWKYSINKSRVILSLLIIRFLFFYFAFLDSRRFNRRTFTCYHYSIESGYLMLCIYFQYLVSVGKFS